MMGMKQFFYLVLLLPFISLASNKLPDKYSEEIKSFALFNYDNLIADCYEQEKPYIRQLAKILSEATEVNESIYFNLLNSKEFSNQSIPVKYMILLNKKTLEISSHYFVDE